MEPVHAPDGSSPSHTPITENNFRAIAIQLYYSIVLPFARNTHCALYEPVNLKAISADHPTRAILKGLGIEIKPDQVDIDLSKNDAFVAFISQFAGPIQAIATRRNAPQAAKNATLVEPMFNRVKAALLEIDIPDVRLAIEQASTTPGFWEWIEHQMRDMGARQGFGGRNNG